MLQRLPEEYTLQCVFELKDCVNVLVNENTRLQLNAGCFSAGKAVGV
jgi:hypothetical protein